MAENITQTFTDASESERWAIRFAAEPIDLHLFGKGSKIDQFIENKLGITGGPGAVFNHNYIEIGRLNTNGEFETMKGFTVWGLIKSWK